VGLGIVEGKKSSAGFHLMEETGTRKYLEGSEVNLV
jgi:hypothetical protein